MIRLTRRRLMQGGAALLPLVGFAARAQGKVAQVSLLLDGIGPGTDPGLVERIATTFLSAGLPLTCVADLAGLTAPGIGHAPLCDLLARLALQEPGLFDLALPIGMTGRNERYFQLRRAGALRDAVVHAFAEGPASGQSFPVVTLVDRGDVADIDHTAFRGAGFRVHLRAGDGPFTAAVAGRGELVATGGIWTRLDAPGLDARIGAALAEGGDVLLALSLEGGEAQALAESAAGVAALLSGGLREGRIDMASPARRRLYAGTGLALDVALLVETGFTQDEREAVLAFVRELAAAGVPLTLAGRAEEFGELPGTVHFCATSATDTSLPLPQCIEDGARPDEGAIALHLSSEPAVWPRQGIGADGRLRLTRRALGGAGPDTVLRLAPLEDHVIAIRPEHVLQPVQRAGMVQRFLEAAQSRQAFFHTLPMLANHLVATEPVLERLWSLRRRRLTDPVRSDAPDAGQRARLIEDARLAWRFIERFTDPATGLCAGTVQQGRNRVVNREATMWDLASQLHGIRVARQLALIDADEARARVALLVDNLPLARIDGHPLPPAMFRTDDKAVVTPGFDICDAGRFAVALEATVAAGLLEQERAALVLAGWDLAVALPGGRPYSHVSGRWIDTTASHCTAYIRRGLAPWGFGLVSPLADPVAGSAADRQIGVLYDVAAIAPVGVEPVLLDLIEQGPEPKAELIAEVLFDAQLTWFETTGRMKCASEAPLNFAPWFTYQGLRVGTLGPEAWVVRALGEAPEHDTPEFRDRAELLSAKSAYLWAALRSHPYCDALLAVMRDKARIEGLGFSVGVFTNTMRAMPDYTDLNTNGVILSAIGHALR